MPLRIGFDLDGVLADMDRELIRQAEAIFGETMTRRLVEEAATDTPPKGTPTKEVPTTPTAGAAAQAAAPKATDHDVSRLHMTARQERRLWNHVVAIENFWETLKEIEPGVIGRLAKLAAERRWEIIFLTKRPATAGLTSQAQSQRWLVSKGFSLPSVYVVQGSRGRIAAALGLDIVIDDRPENCLDVVVDSRARAILVWRDDQGRLPSAAKRLGIGVVKSIDECLTVLAHVDVPAPENPGVMDRVMRMLGLKEPA